MHAGVSQTIQPGKIYEGECQVFKEHVRLCLSLDASGFVIERELKQRDGTIFNQVVPIDRAADLFDFAAADPYEPKLQRIYEALRRHYVEAAASELPSIDHGDPIHAIGELAACRSEGQLLFKARAIVAALGGTQFVYQWLRFAGDSAASGDAIETRYLAGCRPAWLQQYLARLWYMNDAWIVYARNNVAPAVTSQINLHREDHWLRTEAKTHGFVSGIVLPAHINRGLIGVLQVSNDIVAPAGEQKLWANRVLLRALSAALLDWQVSHLRKTAEFAYHLTADETIVLKTLRYGGDAANVAEQFGISIHTVYKSIYQRINRKIGVSRINEAVEKATIAGLLD